MSIQIHCDACKAQIPDILSQLGASGKRKVKESSARYAAMREKTFHLCLECSRRAFDAIGMGWK